MTERQDKWAEGRPYKEGSIADLELRVVAVRALLNGRRVLAVVVATPRSRSQRRPRNLGHRTDIQLP